MKHQLHKYIDAPLTPTRHANARAFHYIQFTGVKTGATHVTGGVRQQRERAVSFHLTLIYVATRKPMHSQQRPYFCEDRVRTAVPFHYYFTW